jgi:hypothetical protein
MINKKSQYSASISMFDIESTIHKPLETFSLPLKSNRVSRILEEDICIVGHATFRLLYVSSK